jgi:hypothetical protein
VALDMPPKMRGIEYPNSHGWQSRMLIQILLTLKPTYQGILGKLMKKAKERQK